MALVNDWRMCICIWEIYLNFKLKAKIQHIQILRCRLKEVNIGNNLNHDIGVAVDYIGFDQIYFSFG